MNSSIGISDTLLINLKILSKIQKNGRIARSYDGMISLETDYKLLGTVVQPLKRFFTNDSRKQAVFEINSIINECIDTFYSILNSKHLCKNMSHTDEYSKRCENIEMLRYELENARVGIENLKFTYQNDPNVSSQLDIVLLKISTTLKDVQHKLSTIKGNARRTYTSHGFIHTPPRAPTNSNSSVIELDDIVIDIEK